MLANADINTNGASAATSSQRIRSFRHQTHRASITGNMTTEGLLRVARMKKDKDNASSIKERRFPNRGGGGLETAPPCFLLFDIRVMLEIFVVARPISKNRRSTRDKRGPIACSSAQLPTRLIEPSLGAKPIAPLPATRREHLVAARPAIARVPIRRAKKHSEDDMARATGQRTYAQSKKS